MGLRGPKPKLMEYACPNKACGYFGKTGKGNIVGNGTYLTNGGRVRKLICRSCDTIFCSREGTAFYDLRSDVDMVILAIKMLLKGMSLRGVAETLDVKLDTVRGWLRKAAEHADSINDILIRRLNVSRIELDELWSFIKKNSYDNGRGAIRGRMGMDGVCAGVQAHRFLRRWPAR